MKRILVFLLLFLTFTVHAQSSITSFDDLDTRLNDILDAEGVDAQILSDELYEELEAFEQIPFVDGEQVAFFYRGDADSVEWRGDFNGWEADGALEGEPFGDTNLWYATLELPIDSRIEYKIVLDGDNWILDPGNPRQVMSGFGPNNELAMPEFSVTLVTDIRDDIEHGNVSEQFTLDSPSLAYTVGYWVYTPAGYEDLDNLPVLYITDGNDFILENMGAIVPALDNMIADGKIEPVMAVLISARDPEDESVNRREDEFLENPQFAGFVARELVPVIDENYKTAAAPEGRLIMGVSYGGVAAPYIAILYPDVFDNLVALSPSLWAASQEMGQMYLQSDDLPSKVFLSGGNPDWDNIVDEATLEMLDSKGVDYLYVQTNEGHSWGNWRGMLDEMLTFFYGKE